MSNFQKLYRALGVGEERTALFAKSGHSLVSTLGVKFAQHLEFVLNMSKRRNQMKKRCSILLSLSLLPGIGMANVIVNGTFGNNTTGWSGTYFSQPGSSSGFPTINTGSYYWGGNNSSNTISQVYDLAASDISSLMSVGLEFSMSADLFGFASQGDHSVFKASFYSGIGASGSVLGFMAFDSATNDPGVWSSSFIAGNSPNYQDGTGVLPSLTTSILFELQSIRLAGTANDGYADNLSFSISPTSVAVPEPSVALLVASGFLGFIGRTRKANLKM
jgi:hypothetical protein